MEITDDYSNSRTMAKSAVSDLIDASSTPLWKRSIDTALSRAGVGAAYSAMPLVHDNALSRLTGIMGTVSPVGTSGFAGLVGASSLIEDQLSHFKSLSQGFLTGLNSPLKSHSNFESVGLQVAGIVGASAIAREALNGLSAVAPQPPNTDIGGFGVSNMLDVSSIVGDLSSLAPKIDAGAIGIGQWATHRTDTGMIGANYAISARLRDAVGSILKSAEEFDLEYGGTEVEETANEFLDDHVAIAEQVYGSPFLRTLSLHQRSIVATYLAFLVYIVFVSAIAFGDSEYPEAIHLLEIFGIDLAPIAAATSTYKGSKKFMDKHLAAEERD